MAQKYTPPTFKLPTVPAGENTPFVQGLMQLCAELIERVVLLGDEVAVLKGHKPRPKSRAAT